MPEPTLDEPKLRGHLITFSERDWRDLHIQAALECKAGRGDIVRKAVRSYLDETKDQRMVPASK